MAATDPVHVPGPRADVALEMPRLSWGAARRWAAVPARAAVPALGTAAMGAIVGLSGAIVLVAASGVLYTVGAVVYTRRRPDPRPQVFGYHELFHVLTVAAVACEYVVVAFYVLPRA